MHERLPVRIRAQRRKVELERGGHDESRDYPTVLSQNAITNYIVSSIIT